MVSDPSAARYVKRPRFKRPTGHGTGDPRARRLAAGLASLALTQLEELRLAGASETAEAALQTNPRLRCSEARSVRHRDSGQVERRA